MPPLNPPPCIAETSSFSIDVYEKMYLTESGALLSDWQHIAILFIRYSMTTLKIVQSYAWIAESPLYDINIAHTDVSAYYLASTIGNAIYLRIMISWRISGNCIELCTLLILRQSEHRYW